MRTCPVCGFHHPDADAVCIRCGAALVDEASTEQFIERRAATAIRDRPLGAVLSLFYRLRGATARVLYVATRPFHAPLARDIEHQPPFRAAFLSLIPGGGQLYNRQPWKAAVFIGVWCVLLAVSVLTLFAPYSNWILLGLLLWAAYAFHDGYRTARRINGDPWHLRLSLAFYVAWLFEFAIFCLLAQYFLGIVFVKFRHMSEPALSPVIERGDRFVLDILTYRFRPPRVGEIVYYRPEQISLDAGKNMYIEAPLNGIERIVGLPGDSFARKGDRYFRNGKPVPRWEQPINQSEVRWNYELEAPEDHYIVIRSYTSVDSFGPSAPRMYEVLNVAGWEEACLVSREDIFGRAVLVYHPPPRRRLLTNGRR